MVPAADVLSLAGFRVVVHHGFMIVRTGLFLLFLASLAACSEASRPDASTEDLMKASANGGLRLRAEPNLEAKRLGLIPDGTLVKKLGEHGEVIEIAGKKGKWIKIQWDELSGYAFGAFLVPVDGAGNQAAADAEKVPADVIQARISELAGVTLPALKTAPRMAFENGPPHIPDFKVVVNKAAGRHRGVSISPTGETCDGYGFSNCYSVITTRDGSYEFSDIDLPALGAIENFTEDCVRFRIRLGEGSACGFSGEGEDAVYFFNTKKLIFQKYEVSATCPCDCDPDAGCACDLKPSRKISYRLGDVPYEPVAAELACFDENPMQL